MYGVHCILYTALTTLYNVHCTCACINCIVQYTMYSVHAHELTVLYNIYIYIIHCTYACIVYNVHCTMYSVHAHTLTAMYSEHVLTALRMRQPHRACARRANRILEKTF